MPRHCPVAEEAETWGARCLLEITRLRAAALSRTLPRFPSLLSSALRSVVLKRGVKLDPRMEFTILAAGIPCTCLHPTPPPPPDSDLGVGPGIEVVTSQPTRGTAVLRAAGSGAPAAGCWEAREKLAVLQFSFRQELQPPEADLGFSLLTFARIQGSSCLGRNDSAERGNPGNKEAGSSPSPQLSCVVPLSCSRHWSEHLPCSDLSNSPFMHEP